MDWKKAKNWLNEVITEYTAVGYVGKFALQATLLPLKKRYDDGERTQELYDEIMSCE